MEKEGTVAQFLYDFGRLSANHSAVERSLCIFIAALVNKRDVRSVFAVACELRFDSMLAVLKTLYTRKVSSIKRIKRLGKILEKLRHLNKKRNTYIHSSWEKYSNTSMLRVKSSTTFDSGFDVAAVVVSLEDVNETANKLMIYGKELQSIFIEYAPKTYQQIERDWNQVKPRSKKGRNG